jgi:parvulin-like peptidyl-prolyl isomerase
MAPEPDLRYARNFGDGQHEGSTMRIATMIAGPLAGLRALAAATALAALAAASPAPAQSRFEAAAKVNDQVITRYDVEQRARLLALGGGPRGADLEARALEQLVEDKLKLEAAQRAGLAPSPEAGIGVMQEYGRARGMETVAELENRLRAAGVDPAALRDALVADSLWRDAVRRRFGPRAEPSEAELDQELALAAAGQARSWRVSEIVIPARGNEDAAMERARDIARRLAQGEDFAALARRESAAPSAAQGGEIGWIAEGALPPQIASALAQARDGGVTEPIASAGGVAILKRLEMRSEQPASVTVELVLVQGAGGDAMRRVRAFVDARPTCDAAEGVAQAQGLQFQRSQPTDLSALPPQTREAVGGLQESEVAGPLRGGGAVAAFVMCRRIDGTSPEARESLRAQVRNQRLVGFASGWLQELRGSAVIETR